MDEMDTGDVDKAIASLRQPKPASTVEPTNTIEGDRINSRTEINSKRTQQAQRIAAVEAEQFKQQVGGYLVDFYKYGTPQHLLRPDEQEQLRRVEEAQDDFFEGEIVEAMSLSTVSLLPPKTLAALPSK